MNHTPRAMARKLECQFKYSKEQMEQFSVVYYEEMDKKAFPLIAKNLSGLIGKVVCFDEEFTRGKRGQSISDVTLFQIGFSNREQVHTHWVKSLLFAWPSKEALSGPDLIAWMLRQYPDQTTFLHWSVTGCDEKILRQLFFVNNHTLPKNWNFFNLLPIARMLWRPATKTRTSPFVSRSLPFLATLLFPDESFTFHDAGEDARATYMIYDWICKQIPKLEEFEVVQDYEYAYESEMDDEDEGFYIDE